MSSRHILALIVIFCTTSQLGCVCTRQFGCGSGGCGMGGQVFNDCCPSCGVADSCCDCPSCGVADVSCGCPDATCGCPDASCGCPDSCGGGVGCGTAIGRGCPLLARIRNALSGCYGGCGQAYRSEWSDSPPSQCESCDHYGNYTGDRNIGGPYGSPHGRRAQMAKRNFNLNDELRFSEEESGPIYR